MALLSTEQQHWALTELRGVEIDCCIAVMLKILDGKCKMNPQEKQLMAELYDVLRQQPNQLLEATTHDIIAQARQQPEPVLLEHIYELRVLAETRISRPIMKAFKARLRAAGLLADTNALPAED